MTFEEFGVYICDAVEALLADGTRVSITENRKNNDMLLHGMVFQRPDKLTSPVLYLESYYQMYRDGTPLSAIPGIVVGLYEMHRGRDFEDQMPEDYETCRERIFCKVISRERNQRLLDDVPYVPYLDLAIVFCIYVRMESEEGSILIHNAMFRSWDISLQTLYDNALMSSPKVHPMMLKPFSDLFPVRPGAEEGGTEENQMPLYLLTSKPSIFGASVILYSGVLKSISYYFGDDFWVLPSSVHEVILVPADSSDHMEGSILRQMVREVNRAEVAQDEILSDEVYYFSASEGLRIYEG